MGNFANNSIRFLIFTKLKSVHVKKKKELIIIKRKKRYLLPLVARLILVPEINKGVPELIDKSSRDQEMVD